MFNLCLNLQNVKSLNALIIEENSYSYMFSESSIVTSPQIYAECVGKKGCHRMFYKCKSLVNGPSFLKAKVIAESAYNGILQ
jgi:hypothetical protein